tara:strand:+ start:580 stop:804 length:225 start_codon:yes stop_codon:yes gene_type:complete
MELEEFNLCEEAIKFDGLDDCIIGTDQRGLLVYSHKKMLDYFSKSGMNVDEAAEYIEFNVVGIKPDNYTVVYEI